MNPTIDVSVANVDNVKRQLCELDLRFLCTKICNFADWDVCHDDLVSFYRMNNGVKFKLLLLPRGHLKTSILTVGKTIQDILINPNVKILLTSAIWNNSRTFLAQIKEYLRPGSELERLYGKFMRSDVGGWTQDFITINQRTTPDKSPTIDTAGVEKTVTSQHYDKIKADDLVTRENITNKDQIEKVINHFRDLSKLLEPNGELEIIGTRWHDADLYGYIIKNLCDSRAGERKFIIYLRRAVEENKVIFPKKFTIQKLDALKTQIGTYEYSANYNNNPIDPERQMFKPPVRYWHEIPKDATRIITIDPAGDNTDSDYNVVTDCAFSKANQLYVAEYRRGHFNPDQLIQNLFEMVTDKPHLLGVGVESVQYQRVLQYLIRIEQKRRGVYFPIYPVIPHKDKFTRLRALQPWWERGDLLLKPGMVELEDEFTRFPVSEYDDIMDTIEQAVHIFQGYAYKAVEIDKYADLQKVSPASADEWRRVDKLIKPKKQELKSSSIFKMYD